MRRGCMFGRQCEGTRFNGKWKVYYKGEERQFQRGSCLFLGLYAAGDCMHIQHQSEGLTTGTFLLPCSHTILST